MKETFKSYMELLVSIALDPDTMQALEKSNGMPTKEHTQIVFV